MTTATIVPIAIGTANTTTDIARNSLVSGSWKALIVSKIVIRAQNNMKTRVTLDDGMAPVYVQPARRPT